MNDMDRTILEAKNILIKQHEDSKQKLKASNTKLAAEIVLMEAEKAKLDRHLMKKKGKLHRNLSEIRTKEEYINYLNQLTRYLGEQNRE